ncbi:hypothetical protein OMP38_32135 [Cohnella ginsengisoli]|uniref:Uncharacterized protein n=1 Tax=Cohnella ginsengisoli TaxID=425004 RepID=A0A9X4QQT8_9BACL|nr:hypothetical protein [Cohnella ginsengisoli]MDG0794961.1 hypothetical protein [Cohnella ginsengisoli]
MASIIDPGARSRSEHERSHCYPVAVVWQPVAGVLLAGLASAFLVWEATAWYGMELAAATHTWLFLWLAGAAFYMIQSALLNWIGMPAMAIAECLY